MAMGYGYCKVCGDFLISEEANYCSAHCRHIDSRLFFGKYAVVFLGFIISIFIAVALILKLDLLFSGMIISGTILMILLPMYQFYQSARIEQRLKISYKQTRHNIDDGKGQPVYIYLYINRHTEQLFPDEDYSEYA